MCVAGDVAGGGGKLRSGAADRAVGPSALRAARAPARPWNSWAISAQVRASISAWGWPRTPERTSALSSTTAIGYVPSVGGRHGCAPPTRAPCTSHPLRERPKPLGAVYRAGRQAVDLRRRSPSTQPLDIRPRSTRGHLGHGAGVHPTSRRCRPSQNRRRRVELTRCAGAAARPQQVIMLRSGRHCIVRYRCTFGRRRSAGIRIDNQSTLAGCLG